MRTPLVLVSYGCIARTHCLGTNTVGILHILTTFAWSSGKAGIKDTKTRLLALNMLRCLIQAGSGGSSAFQVERVPLCANMDLHHVVHARLAYDPTTSPLVMLELARACILS